MLGTRKKGTIIWSTFLFPEMRSTIVIVDAFLKNVIIYYLDENSSNYCFREIMNPTHKSSIDPTRLEKRKNFHFKALKLLAFPKNFTTPTTSTTDWKSASKTNQSTSNWHSFQIQEKKRSQIRLQIAKKRSKSTSLWMVEHYSRFKQYFRGSWCWKRSFTTRWKKITSFALSESAQSFES